MNRLISPMILALCVSSAWASPALDDAPFKAFDTWRERYLRADDLHRPVLVAEGQALARHRRTALAQLIELDPAQALTRTQSIDEMPPEVALLMEQPLDAPATLEVLGYLGFDGRLGIERRLKVGEQRFRLTVYGELKHLKTQPLRAKGIRLGEWGALKTSRSLLSGPQASLWTVGTKKLLYMRVDFSDATMSPITEPAASNTIDQLSNYYKASSYNKTSIAAVSSTGSCITPVMRMPQTKAFYNSNNATSQLLGNALNEAGKSTVSGGVTNPCYQRSFDLQVVAFTKMSGWGWAGLGMIGSAGTWLNGTFGLGVIGHEVGHNYGLYHANFWEAPGETIIGAGNSLEYGNPFEVMGSGDGQHNAWYKDLMEWFGVGEVETIASASQSGTYRIQDLEAVTTGGIHAVKVPLSGQLDYWLEFRPTAVPGAVVINWGFPYSDSSQLLDHVPWTLGAEDSALAVGRTFSDFNSGIHITPVSLPSVSPSAIDVVVNRGLFPTNHVPTVSLMASSTSVSPGASVTFTATAADLDSDPLAYYWDFGDNSGSTNQATQMRSFSQAQDVVARVVVSDMKGGTATAWVTVVVGSPSTYRITGAVKQGSTGIEGVHITTTSRSAWTDSSGNYVLVVPSGNYVLQAIKPGWTLSPSFANPVSVTSANKTGIDFTASQVTYPLTGKVMTYGNVGVPNVTVTAGTYSTVSSSTGDFVIPNVPAGAYNLVATQGAGSTSFKALFTNPVQVTNSAVTGLNFIEEVVPLSGEITGGAGPHTVTDGVRITTTALSGGKWLYRLDRVPPGKWNVWATAAGQVLAPTFTNPVDVAGLPVTGLNFNSTPGNAYLVRGHIDEAGTPLTGTTVTDGTHSSTTDGMGNYVLANVPNGAYTVTPSKAGYQFSPASLPVTVAGADVVNVDFGVLNPNAPPVFSVPPHATPSPVLGTTTNLTVLGDDPIEGEGALTYHWSSIFGPAAVTFSLNGTNAAKSTDVTFTKPGAYAFQIELRDGGGLSVRSQITVLVLQTTTTVTVTPATALVEVDAEKQFVASAADQFGGAIDFGGEAAWSNNGGGTLTSTGKFTAATVGNWVVTATVNGKSGDSNVSVIIGPIPRVAVAPMANPNPVVGDTTALSVLGSDDQGEDKLVYTWAAVNPPAAVQFSVNGTNAAKNTTATFAAIGSYNLKVDITDENGLSATGFITVVVQAGLSVITIVPADASVDVTKTIAFTATGKDQLGAPIALSGCVWSVSGGGSIDANGVFTAETPGAFSTTLTCGLKSASVNFTVKGTLGGNKPCGCSTNSSAPLWLALALLAYALLRHSKRDAMASGNSTSTPYTGTGTGTGTNPYPRTIPIPIPPPGTCTNPYTNPIPNTHANPIPNANAKPNISILPSPRSLSPFIPSGVEGRILSLLSTALLATACTESPPPSSQRLESSAAQSAPTISRAELGEPAGGYPSDQERMLHVLVNQTRHSAKTPNDMCGDWTQEVGADVKKTPLVYSREANLGARFTSKHMSELGCYQHDNCCVLGDAGTGVPSCLAPAACTGSGCAKTCDAGTGQTFDERYKMFGFNTLSAESIGQNVTSALDMWCAWMQSAGTRGAMYDDAGTQIGPGAYSASGQTCNGTYWTLALGNAAVTVPRVPAASAIYIPPNPINTAQMYFAANYYDPSGKAPQRSVVVVAGHCFDLDRAWGFDDNGTYEARFTDPDVLPDGCHPYYFLFQDGDGQRVTYPTVGSLQLPLGASASCAVAYDPSSQLAADCETGVQQCPTGGERACYTADNATLTHGECRQGHQVCKNGFWSACKDMIGPFPETCDGLDNNCDGQVDEGNPGGSASCAVFGERGLCSTGVRQCTSGRLTCIGTVQPATDVCNGVDDDCDGVVDDGFSIATCGQGECFRIAKECSINGVPGACVPGQPSAEIDDGLDNDCDGIIDNGVDCRLPDGGGVNFFRDVYLATARWVDGGTYPVTLPCGLPAKQRCQSDGGWSATIGGALPSKELCDGVDNNCNGKTDNQDIDEIGWERCGRGACTAFVPTCISDVPKTCRPTDAGSEICDGIDNSCDGTVDEGCGCRLGDERPCYTGPQVTRDAGVCHAGKRTCVAGTYTKCQGELKPSTEYCDGLDNDCNGVIDNTCIAAPDSGTGGGTGGGSGAGGGGGTDATGGGTGGGGEKKPGCGCSSGAEFMLGMMGLLLAARRKRTG